MSACAIATLRWHANKFALKLPAVSYASRTFRLQLNPYSLFSYGAINSGGGNNALRNKTLFDWKIQQKLDRSRVILSASSLRAFGSENLANNGEKEEKVDQQTSSKKQLKTEDIFRILSLAKPEYKSLAGN